MSLNNELQQQECLIQMYRLQRIYASSIYVHKYYDQLHSALCTFEKGGRRGAHAIHGSFYEPRFFSYLFCFVLKKRRPDCLVVVDNLFRTL